MEAVGVFIIVFMLFLLTILAVAIFYQILKIVEEDREYKVFMKELRENEHR